VRQLRDREDVDQVEEQLDRRDRLLDAVAARAQVACRWSAGSAALMAACAFLVLALIVTGITLRRGRADSTASEDDPSVLATTASPGHPAAEALSECEA